MDIECKTTSILVLLFTSIVLCAQTTQLKVGTISAGAALLDNGSLVNIGQPLVGVFGTPQAGVVGSAGIISALRRATAPPQLPVFNPLSWNTNGGLRLTFQTAPGWTYTVEASTNLIDWSSVWTTNALSPTVTFEDLDAVQYKWRFYRLRTD